MHLFQLDVYFIFVLFKIGEEQFCAFYFFIFYLNSLYIWLSLLFYHFRNLYENILLSWHLFFGVVALYILIIFLKIKKFLSRELNISCIFYGKYLLFYQFSLVLCKVAALIPCIMTQVSPIHIVNLKSYISCWIV